MIQYERVKIRGRGGDAKDGIKEFIYFYIQSHFKHIWRACSKSVFAISFVSILLSYYSIRSPKNS